MFSNLLVGRRTDDLADLSGNEDEAIFNPLQDEGGVCTGQKIFGIARRLIEGMYNIWLHGMTHGSSNQQAGCRG